MSEEISLGNGSNAESILLERELTGQILEAAFRVHNSLGVGFLEKVYRGAMMVELREMGISCEAEKYIPVRYKGFVVGDYQADLIVAGKVLLELKTCQAIDPSHGAQVMNYLRATGIRIGFVLNFGRPKLEFRRFVAG